MPNGASNLRMSQVLDWQFFTECTLQASAHLEGKSDRASDDHARASYGIEASTF